MIRHHTPMQVAQELARYAPKRVSSVLDTCAGSGVLVEPFLRRPETKSIVCVDLDPKVPKLLDRFVKHDSRVSVVVSDFLSWSALQCEAGTAFDCVVMNPPFAARKQSLTKLTGGTRELRRHVPSEAAFILDCIPLLPPRGRLLAIVPDSVITSSSGAWLRRHLGDLGAIRTVHELPRHTFAQVEGRTYLLVFERDARNKHVVLKIIN